MYLAFFKLKVSISDIEEVVSNIFEPCGKAGGRSREKTGKAN